MATLIKMAKSSLVKKPERDAARTTPMLPGSYGHFPRSFGLYYSGVGNDYMSQTFALGERASDPIYAVTFHRAPGMRTMTLYSTPEPYPPALAIAFNTKRFSSSASMALPPVSVENESPQHEQMKYKFGSSVNVFSLHSDQGLVSFEWRESPGRPTVRRLWRIAREAEEVVAIWTEGTVPSRDGKVAVMEFPKSSFVADLDDYWRLMAVATALRVCQSQWAALTGAQEFQREKNLFDGKSDPQTVKAPFWDYNQTKTV